MLLLLLMLFINKLLLEVVAAVVVIGAATGEVVLSTDSLGDAKGAAGVRGVGPVKLDRREAVAVVGEEPI
jgi:hypothetical protein